MASAPNYVPSQAALNAARKNAPTWGMGTYGLPAPNKALPGLSNRNAATNKAARTAVSAAVKSGAFDNAPQKGGRRRKSHRNHKKQSQKSRKSQRNQRNQSRR